MRWGLLIYLGGRTFVLKKFNLSENQTTFFLGGCIAISQLGSNTNKRYVSDWMFYLLSQTRKDLFCFCLCDLLDNLLSSKAQNSELIHL